MICLIERVSFLEIEVTSIIPKPTCFIDYRIESDVEIRHKKGRADF